MKKMLRSRKQTGTTLVEVIVALAILGIISSVATVCYVSSMQTSMKSKEQMEINAVIDMIRVSVSISVKNDYPLDDTGKMLRNGAGTLITSQSAVKVVDGMGTVNEKYLYDVSQVSTQSAITPPSVVVYNITLKKADGKVLRKLKLEINTLEFKNDDI